MSTVGYGDIVPTNEAECLFVLFAELVGVVRNRPPRSCCRLHPSHAAASLAPWPEGAA
jgi:hypothetical protein